MVMRVDGVACEVIGSFARLVTRRRLALDGDVRDAEVLGDLLANSRMDVFLRIDGRIKDQMDRQG